MVIAGANRHAKEVMEELNDLLTSPEQLSFFDDTVLDSNKLFLDRFPLINSIIELKKVLKYKPEFVLGVGNPFSRKILYDKFIECGGVPKDVISKQAKVGHIDVTFGQGVNFMSFTLVSNCVSIGTGVLINAFASVHHDVEIGDFVEISPGARILGNCRIGSLTSVGSNATILPGVTVGNNVKVGAGAVVTKDIESNLTVIGVPAKRVEKPK